MKRIVITGGTGFIGTHLIDPLMQRGFEIHVIGRRPPSDRELVFHQADVLDVKQTREALASAKASHLLHLAWTVKPGGYWRSSDNLDWVAASLGLVRNFAEIGGARAVIAGTCAEYLWGAGRFHERETPCEPATLYGAAKDALRRLLSAYGDLAPLSIGWGRIFYLYGPGERQGRLVGDAIRHLLARSGFAASHGRQRRDYMHVSDVADAFVALIDCDVRGPVNIGSGTAISVRSLLERIARDLGSEGCVRFGERPDPVGEPEQIEADIGRLSHEVGFRPRFDIPSGIADTIARFKEQSTC